MKVSCYSVRAVLAAVVLTGSAMAEDMTFGFSDVTGPRADAIAISVGTKTVRVKVAPGTSATTKRDLVRDSLRGRGFSVVDDGPGGRTLTVLNVDPVEPAILELNATGEEEDQISCVRPESAVIRFAGVFEPWGGGRQPAVFTAGIVTDIGVLTERVSAADLQFQADGPVVCQALFQRLAPRAPQYGAQVVFSGDRLEVYFDQAYTLQRGGIWFGTTSPSPGCRGELRPFNPDGETTLAVSPAGSPQPSVVGLGLNDAVIEIPIPPLASSGGKRDTVREAALAAGLSVIDTWGREDALTVKGLRSGDVVTFATGASAEQADRLTAPRAVGGTVTFGAAFQPISPQQVPASFTAGMVTDLGELTETVSAQDLQFQTEGPVVCQALFQRLAPRAPQYGGRILLAGDRLEVYFDPAYTVGQGGLIFGTTSPTPGLTGALVQTDLLEPPKKKCLVVTAPIDSRVYIEYKASNGQWMKLKSKQFGKLDKEWKVCDLEVGGQYRIIGRKEGDDNEGNWKEFTFNPDSATGEMHINVVIKMR